MNFEMPYSGYNIRSLLVDSRVLTAFLLVVSSVLLLVPVLFIRNPYTVILPSSLFIAGSASVAYHRMDIPSFSWHTQTVRVDRRVLSVLWSISFAAAVILYHQNGGSRTLAVNTLLLALYLIPILLVVRGGHSYAEICLLLITGIVHRALIYFASPVPYGNDSHFHYGRASYIADAGGLEILQGSKELYSPFFHVMGGISSLLLDIPVRKGAIFLAMGISITVVGTLIVYYIASHYWNETVGFLSAMLFITSDRLVGNFLVLSGTTQLGLLFFILTIYSIDEYSRTNSTRHFGIFVSSIVALTFTHQATTFVTACAVVGGMSLVAIVDSYERTLRNLTLVMGGVLFSDWIATQLRGRSFLDWILGNLLIAVSGFELFGSRESTIDVSEYGYAIASPMESTGYVHVLPVGMLFLFAAFGILYWVHNRKQDATRIISFIGGGIIVLLALIFAGSVLDLPFVPSRWFMHLYVLLTIPAGVGLFGILALVLRAKHNSSVVLCCLLVLTTPYIALMGANHISAIDDPVLDDVPAAERKAFTEPEVATIKHTVQFSEAGTTVYSDQSHGAIIRYYVDEDISYRVLFFTVEEGRFPSQMNGPEMIINRRYMTSGHTRFNIRIQDNRVGVRGEVPIAMAVSGQSKVYQAESRCNEYPCGIYLQN
jgi:hypothetical protein